MITLHAIPPGDLALAGRLTFVRSGPRRRPSLTLEFLDPLDRVVRSVVVPEDFDVEGAVEVSIPGLGRSAFVTAAPGMRQATRETVALFRARMRAWRTEERLAGRLAAPLVRDGRNLTGANASHVLAAGSAGPAQHSMSYPENE